MNVKARCLTRRWSSRVGGAAECILTPSFHPPYLPRGTFSFHKNKKGTYIAICRRETDDVRVRSSGGRALVWSRKIRYRDNGPLIYDDKSDHDERLSRLHVDLPLSNGSNPRNLVRDTSFRTTEPHDYTINRESRSSLSSFLPYFPSLPTRGHN
jgi:hypothetical protein